jgi:hypothetical protein
LATSKSKTKSKKLKILKDYEPYAPLPSIQTPTFILHPQPFAGVEVSGYSIPSKKNEYIPFADSLPHGPNQFLEAKSTSLLGISAILNGSSPSSVIYNESNVLVAPKRLALDAGEDDESKRLKLQ